MPPYPLAVARTTTRRLRDLECVIVDDKRIALFRYAIRAARRLGLRQRQIVPWGTTASQQLKSSG